MDVAVERTCGFIEVVGRSHWISSTYDANGSTSSIGLMNEASKEEKTMEEKIHMMKKLYDSKKKKCRRKERLKIQLELKMHFVCTTYIQFSNSIFPFSILSHVCRYRMDGRCELRIQYCLNSKPHLLYDDSLKVPSHSLATVRDQLPHLNLDLMMLVLVLLRFVGEEEKSG